MLKKVLGGAPGFLFALYMLGASVAVLNFNWRYARDHGFVKWILLGEIVPTAKAFIWPYFAFFSPHIPSWSDEEKQNATHFVLSLDASRSATNLLNLGPAYSSIPPATIAEVLRLRKFALEEAKLVRDKVLEKALSGMSRPFRDKYQRSLELEIQAFESQDETTANAASIKGSMLHDEWVDWINEHNSKVRIPK